MLQQWLHDFSIEQVADFFLFIGNTMDNSEDIAAIWDNTNSRSHFYDKWLENKNPVIFFQRLDPFMKQKIVDHYNNTALKNNPLWYVEFTGKTN